MNVDTKWFLSALLWDVVAEGLDETGALIGKTVNDFRPKLVTAVEGFIADFRRTVEIAGFDTTLFNSLTRPFGAQLYLSLSANSIGFSSEGSEAMIGLHDKLSGYFELLVNYITVKPDGLLDLDFPEEDLDRMHRKIFTPYTWE